MLSYLSGYLTFVKIRPKVIDNSQLYKYKNIFVCVCVRSGKFFCFIFLSATLSVRAYIIGSFSKCSSCGCGVADLAIALTKRDLIVESC